MDDRQAYSIISSRLQPGEKLLWHGVPAPWSAARGSLFSLVFMTFWAGFAFVWTFLAATITNGHDTTKSPLLFVAFGGLFCIIGTVGWISALRSLLNCWQTAYGVTDRRVIIAVGATGKTLSFTAVALSGLSRSGNDDQGSLQFDYGRQGRGSAYRNGLYGIKNPARVEALIYENLITQKPNGAAA